jgi:predicted nuclease of restriction endonuclease-like (RecB) superfamily
MGKELTTRKGRASKQEEAFFPVPPAENNLPEWYAETLSTLKELVANSRRQIMWTANAQMTMMYYQIGKQILQRQKADGWGAHIVDRLSADLKTAFPDQNGFSPRNLKYMRRFAEIWPDEAIVQRSVAQLPWRHNICFSEEINEPIGIASWETAIEIEK